MPFVLILAGLLLLAAPARAEAPRPLPPQQTEEWRQAEKYARDALDNMMRSFDALLQAMPYGPPRVDGDGNIVIPRQRPHPLPPGGDRDGTVRS